ncbi:hypothetical protein CLPUN_29740 [Clostridium puniceum]|uniref:DUF1097 domain-containing protein n=2 Tax=Clostridium puniceum TaxID=29367 RepID=A0A1S8TDN5_9CLOT|nr:hypothetical protein CLPUN_29740 [Clostridium puniceum]
MSLRKKCSTEEIQKHREEIFKVITLAMGIGLLPPIWAVLSPFLGIKVGGVALVCAALFVANGNKIQDIIKISVGFAISVAWGCIASYIINVLPWNKSINVFITLCSMGVIAVLIASSRLKKIIYLPSWLCGWAITLGILGELPMGAWGNIPMAILVSMIVGVVYVGAGVLVFGNFINKLLAYISSI